MLNWISGIVSHPWFSHAAFFIFGAVVFSILDRITKRLDEKAEREREEREERETDRQGELWNICHSILTLGDTTENQSINVLLKKISAFGILTPPPLSVRDTLRKRRAIVAFLKDIRPWLKANDVREAQRLAKKLLGD